MRIVAVDDENGARKLLAKAITDNLPNDELVLFDNPTEALASCTEKMPDIAFLDINMPGITGLELAKKLKEINPKVNIIFVTGYSEYAREAFSLHASGYLTKPVTAKDVKKELEQLRNPILDEAYQKDVFIKTFGNFDVFVGGHHINFSRGLAKEVLAYLVDREGASVTRKELAAVLFEDSEYSRSVQSYLTQILKSLMETLNKEGIGDIVEVTYNSYAIKKDRFKCDAYDYLSGVPTAINAFCGEYMAQYSWAENYIGKFYK